MLMDGPSSLLGLMFFLQLLQIVMATDCPLDLSGSNFTLPASVCSNQDTRAKCCRYINALVAVSVSRYANLTSNLGVPQELNTICLKSISDTLELYGTPRNATVLCGLGTKIPFKYLCNDRETVTQMLETPTFGNVTGNCQMPLSVKNDCRKCINAGIMFVRRLVGNDSNIKLSVCRDATFATIASRGDYGSAVGIASCFFGIPELGSSFSGVNSSTPSPASTANQLLVDPPLKEHHRHYRRNLIAGIGLSVTFVAVSLLIVVILLIRRKRKELEESEVPDVNHWRKAHPSNSSQKSHESSLFMFRKFSYDEIKKATGNFCMIVEGGYGTVYKAQFDDGFVAAVKRMNKVSEQEEDDFFREMEILGRLQHRHLVSLRGFCIEKHQRFLIYEYMENGCLKDHLHTPGMTPLSWQARIQIAIDVANALEYLHFYCDPPVCHGNIKSRNILLDEQFVAKVADFGLAHAFRSGAVSLPLNTDIRGTPGYMDPENVATQELTENTDVYSYGVLLLELVTGRPAIQDNKTLVEWSQIYMETESRVPELVDPNIVESIDMKQLQTVVEIIRWCTRRKGRARPSIKQVFRLLCESSDPLSNMCVHDMEDEDYEGGESGRGSKVLTSNSFRSYLLPTGTHLFA